MIGVRHRRLRSVAAFGNGGRESRWGEGKTMRLFDLKAGMNPRRVRIFLAEKGIEVPVSSIDMMKGENRTPEFLKLNPLGTLPVLELDDGVILTESVADRKSVV